MENYVNSLEFEPLLELSGGGGQLTLPLWSSGGRTPLPPNTDILAKICDSENFF